MQPDQWPKQAHEILNMSLGKGTNQK